MRYENAPHWVHIWSWSFSDMQARIEVNPLNWEVGFGLGDLGVRFDFLCVGLGLVWGAACCSTEEIERDALAKLKAKYEK